MQKKEQRQKSKSGKPRGRQKEEVGEKNVARVVLQKKPFPVNFKLFGRWDSTGIEVNDPGIRPYINLDPRFMPRSAGRLRNPFHKSKAHIAERLATHLMVPGHQGKKHKITSGHLGGTFYNAIRAVENAMEIIEKKTGKNPVEVLVRAVERAAPREEIISYQAGSTIAREGVIPAPQRRVDKTLRFLSQGTYKRTFSSKHPIAQALAEEIMAASEGKECFAIKEKDRLEREAVGAR